MSHRSRTTTRKLATPASTRRDMLTAAITPLLEMLEHRSLFSAAPTADPGGPYNLNEGQSILIDGRSSSDSDGTVATYQWDTNYNAGKGFKQRFTGPTWNFTADTSGSRTIALRVVDNSGDVSSIQTATINIADVAPTITLNAPSTGDEGSAVNISWSHTDPGIEDVVTAWEVDWGDDSAPTTLAGNATASSHVYAEDGDYTITLTSTQADGQTSVTSDITITQVTPIVEASTTTPSIDEGEMVQIDFACLNRLDSIEGYQIDWGDGNIDVLGPNRTHASHFYTDSGVYTATVSAQEPDGGLGSATVVYTVGNVAPDVTINGAPASGDEGAAINVTSTVTDAGVDDTHVYGWTVYKDGQHYVLPGGTTLDGTSFTFTPTDNGEYEIRLTVIDDEGGETSVVSDTIVVNNVDPTAVISGEPVGNIDEGDTVNLSVTPADASEDDETAGFTYVWSATKGGVDYDLGDATVDEANFDFTPRDNGSYIVSVVVTDKDTGSVTVSTAAIVVDNVAPAPTIDGAPANSDEGTEIEVTTGEHDAGVDDTHTYAWSVEKLSAGGNGTLTFGNGSGELNNYDWGSDFTLTTRMSIDSTTADGTRSVFQDWDMEFGLELNKSGTDYQLRFRDNDMNLASTDVNAFPVDTMFDLAVTYDGTTGAVQFYINGAAVNTTGTLSTGQGGIEHTHFSQSLKASFDQLALYHSVLSAGDIADLHDDEVIGTAPYDLWDFNENVGSTTATSSTANGKTISLSNATFSGASSWQAYTLPGGLDTTSKTFAFVPTDNGSYRIKLTVTDDDGAAVDTQTSTITVANVNPTAVITGDTEGEEAAALNFSVAPSDVAAEDTTFTYLWSVTKGGVSYDLTGVTVDQSTFSFTPDDNETYVVSVQVTDKDGGSVTESTTVTVANVDPTGAITGAPATSPEGTQITLGSTSADVGDDSLSFAWSVTKDGDPVDLTGITADTSSFDFTPDDEGEYEFTLTISDEDGGSVTDTKTVTVENADPTGSISGEPVAPIAEGVQIDLTASGADVGNDTLSYAWTITKDTDPYTPADGTVLDQAALSFVPTDNGTYVATVTITDGDGGSVEIDSQPIIVTNVAPVAAITGAPAGGDEGTAITVGSTVTDDGEADTHTYAWSVTKDGDPVDLTGVTTDAASFTFTPADNGAYEITLTVTDDDGDSDIQTTSFTIDNVAPAPVITGNASVNEGVAIALSVAPGDPGSDDTHTYAWTVEKDGDPYDLTGVTTNTSNFTFTPNLHGSYVVSVLVTDKDGAAETATHNLTVNSVAPTVGITGVPGGPRGEGTPLTFGSTVSDVPAESGFTYAWSVTRGGVAFPLPGNVVTNGTTFEFTPTDNGGYRVTLAITDSGGATGTYTTGNIVITNALPDAILSGEPVGPIDEGTPVTLTVDAEDPGSEDTLTYAWTVKKNGVNWALPNGTVTNTDTFSFTPTDNGTYIATCAIVDDDGGPISVSSTAIVVNNVAPTPAITGAPASGDEGTAITVGSTVSDPGTEDTQSYLWSVTKDGDPYTLPVWVPTAASSFSFTPTDNGDYVISLQVTDDDGGTNTVSTSTITISNVDPTATLSGPTTGTEGAELSYSVTPADAGSDDTHSYAWSVTKDGQAYDLTGITTNASTFAFTPDDNGAYVVSVVVTDDDLGAVTKTANVTVANADPVATITGAPASGIEGTAITVGSTVTDAGSLDTHTYAWSVAKDGAAYDLTGITVDGEDFTFTPGDNGSYIISLTVTDNDTGAATVSTAAITVANANPTAVITGTPVGPIDEGTPIELEVAPSDAGTDDSPFAFEWSVTKDGQPYSLTGYQTHAGDFAFTPNDNGSYIVSVKVTDKDTGSVTVSTTAITVNNVAPTAAIVGAPTTANEGDEILAGALATDAGSADVLSYAWSVTKDGQPFTLPQGLDTTGSSFAFVPTDNGTYVISLTVVDDDLASTTVESDPIVVSNVNPTVALSGPATANEGDELVIVATPSDVGAADTVFTYAWSVTKDGDPVDLTGHGTSAASFGYTPNDEGEYVFTVVVTDKDGGSVTETHTVDVDNVPPTVNLANVPSTGLEGSSITVGSSVSDPGADTLTYGWTVWRNGQHFMLPGGTVITGQSLTFTPTDEGSYVVRLTVLDGDGGSTTKNSSAIAVGGVDPVATIVGDNSVAEGSTLELESTVTDVSSEDENAGFTYAWTVKKGQATVATGTEADFDFTPTVHGNYVVSLLVTDKDGRSTTTTSNVTVTNVAPSDAAIGGVPGSIVEGQAVTLSGSASDAEGDTLTYDWTVTRNGSPFATHSGEEYAFAPQTRGNYSVTLTVTDSAGEETEVSETIVVGNVAPTGAVTGPSSTVLLGNTATFGLSIDDVPPAQALTVTWNFGDGQTETASYTGDQTGISKTHTYAAKGTYSFSVSISDGVDTTVLTRTVDVQPVAIVTDPMDSTKTALMVLGTAGNDTISVAPTAGGKWGVTMNGTTYGSTYAPTGKVYVYGNAGANNVTITGTIDAVVFAGTSTASNVTTGSGNDIIVGTSAADRLSGMAGRDIVIGGAGADILYGGDSEDLLVAQGTTWMNDLGTLKGLKAKWDLGSQDAVTRRTNIKASGVFNANKLIADGAASDNLYSESKADWMIFDAASDKLRDYQASQDLLN